MIVIFYWDVARWTSDRVVWIVAVGDVASRGYVMKMFDKSALLWSELFDDLLVRCPVDGLPDRGWPIEFLFEVGEVLWNRRGFTNTWFVMACNGLVFEFELCMGEGSHWDDRSGVVCGLVLSGFVVCFAIQLG